MSEYQYYEFRAIDRLLDREQMGKLRALSTRADITPRSFTNTYNWGDFRGNPDDLMERYFDAFVYVANWGTNRLMLRIPAGLIDAHEAQPYCDGEVISLKAGKEHAILDFHVDAEDAWDSEGGGEDWMASLMPIRDELMRGDLRALYIGWLASFADRGWLDDEGDLNGDEYEPPVPPGLANLPASLQALAEFLGVDEDLLAAAAGSHGEAVAAPSRSDLAKWVKTLPESEKDGYLVRLLADESGEVLRAELSGRFRKATTPRGQARSRAEGRRKVAELLAVRKAMVAEKARKKVEKTAREMVKRVREKAEARAARLDTLARRETAAWGDVEKLIAMKRAKEYDQAVALLVDLAEIAERSGRADEARDRIRAIRGRHASKYSLIQRLDERGLGGRSG